MSERNPVFLKPIRSLGQNFLINEAVAKIEAEYAEGKNVLELGPGYGILTRELCARAKRVVAVEIDKSSSTIGLPVHEYWIWRGRNPITPASIIIFALQSAFSYKSAIRFPMVGNDVGPAVHV